MEGGMSPKESGSTGAIVSEHAVSDAVREVEGPSALGQGEAAILSLMSQGDHCLSLGTIRSRTGMATRELRAVLDGLRAKGLIVRLDTVVESYASRFPGLDVDRG